MKSDHALPDQLRNAFERWVNEGSPPPVASSWSKSSWSKWLPERREMLSRLYNPISIDQAKAQAGRISDADSALDAFIAVMIWGHGPSGYGAFRTQRIIHDNGGTAKVGRDLYRVSEICKAKGEGGVEAFRSISSARGENRNYLKWLGPAFGTKFLFACTAANVGAGVEVTPVMDALVKRWFDSHAPGASLIVARWDTPSYERYLGCLRSWCIELGATHEQVEQVIFASQRATNSLGNS